MLKIRWLAFVALISLSGCAKYSETQEYTLEESQPPQPTAAAIKECPYGHHALRDVPLIVGLLRMTLELEEKIAKVEIWPTGCTPLGNYKTKVVCMECGVAYDPVLNVWERRLNWGNITLPFDQNHP
jgi:hypothetical protein